MIKQRSYFQCYIFMNMTCFGLGVKNMVEVIQRSLFLRKSILLEQSMNYRYHGVIVTGGY